MYRVLLPEVSEVMQPATYAQLMAAIEDGAKPSTALAFQVVSDIKETHAAIRTPDQLVLFFQNVPFLFLERDEDEPAPLTRRSLFGYFARRCFVSFLKLSFEAVQSLWQDYHLWVNGNLREAYNLFKTQADKKEYAQADAYAL
ncbi:hypothetical protein EW026_g1280 [Hermanssonia centrifuga]|uniref:Uncharacterized protein n=1 Tax=Hermanssonia centrifuga TaxID=98765 RepID=A0A4S4KS18_9APHY|nr:hypothetical protein EW026_g1280 [Hermanssonia centrifuga]